MNRYTVYFKRQEDLPKHEVDAEQFVVADGFACFVRFNDADIQCWCERIAISEILTIIEERLPITVAELERMAFRS